MGVVLYIDWEGRSYTNESLLEDLLNIEKGMGKGPLYSYFYDIGALVTNEMPPDFCEVVRTRHGGMSPPENWRIPDPECDGFLRIDPANSKEDRDVLNPDNWERHENLAAMVWKWFKDGAF